MKNKNNQLKRLAQYTSASAAFLAMHNEAGAVVSYRDIDPDSTINSNDTILLDIDLNGTNDIMFWIESSAGTIETPGGEFVPYTYRFARASALGYNVLIGDNASNSGYVFQNAYQFLSGELIGDTLPLYFADDAFLAGAIISSGVPYYSGGPWSGADGKFIGIRFKIDGFHHWAWIRLSVGTGGSFITVEELAYDMSADISITAGIMSAVETPIQNEKPEIYAEGSNIHIHVKNNEAFTYSIFNLSGKIMQEGNSNVASAQVSCFAIPSGIYIVQVFDGTLAYKEKLFILSE
ncbi:MAG: T9SS type A sorting domain-containing protein [Fimbriimonadaceae bacterium]|nr:T9SS type A sorting domain-containing protein [Chitinophagales bacterium]